MKTEGFSLEKAERALALLSELLFIPKYHADKRYEQDEIDRIVKQFPGLPVELQESTFDCVMAVSKLAMILNQHYQKDEKLRYDQTALGQKFRAGIQ